MQLGGSCDLCFRSIVDACSMFVVATYFSFGELDRIDACGNIGGGGMITN